MTPEAAARFSGRAFKDEKEEGTDPALVLAVGAIVFMLTTALWAAVEKLGSAGC